MPCDFCFEKTDQRWVHELIVIWYIKANDALVVQVLSELRGELASMSLFHDEDDLCPLNELGRDRIIRLIVEASGRAFNARI
jgi:hypothetical protein